MLNEKDSIDNRTLASYISTVKPYTGLPTFGYNMQGFLIKFKFL